MHEEILNLCFSSVWKFLVCPSCLLLTLLSNYPKPCLAFLFGLVMLPESFLIILLPLESSKQGAKAAPQAGKVSLRAPRDPCSSPQILLTFQQKAAGVNYWLQKSQWQRFNLWKVKSSPLFTCLLHTSVLSSGSSCVDAVLMQSSCYCHPTYFYINWTEASKQ